MRNIFVQTPVTFVVDATKFQQCRYACENVGTFRESRVQALNILFVTFLQVTDANHQTTI
jgi:hypothetical protein